MRDLRLGIIGLSQGNGHPYSWSAIFNGYNHQKMLGCGFPVIPEYLSKQEFPRDAISGASVTHIWTQDESLSRNVAEASNVPHVVRHYHDLVDCVDAVLLARDDALNHWRYAESFLKLGMPIYIDKPLALSVKDANRLLNAQQYEGQIFSCSALRYSNSLSLPQDRVHSLGSIRCMVATVPKDWATYAVHGIEALKRFMPTEYEIQKLHKWFSGDRVTIHFETSSDIELEIRTMGSVQSPFSIEIFASHGYERLEYSDTFYSFKSALQDFLNGVKSKKTKISRDDMIQTVSLIEAGLL